VEGSKLLPEPTIDLGPFLPLSVALHGQTLLTRSVLGGSERLLVSCSLGDFLPLRHDLCLFWGWFLFHLHHSLEDFLGLFHGLWLFWSWFLLFLQTSLRPFFASFRCFSTGLRLSNILHKCCVKVH
jgi:hypothetical protein